MNKSLVILVSLLLTACASGLQDHGAPQAWVDAPLDGMVLPLAAYTIVAHASDPTGISQIEISVNDSILGTFAGSGVLFTATQAWTPPGPGEYLIRARGLNSGGDSSEYAEARVVVQGELLGTPAAGTGEPNQASTPSIPTLVLIRNANCRLGPSQVFEAVDAGLAGNALPIEGKNEDATWWLVKLPSGEKCWISAVTGNPTGDLGKVPVDSGPPTPEPEPVNLGCYVYDPNLQPVCTLPCPPNADPGGECTP